MKIDFDGIQAFVLTAELGSFSKAAERLHLTQTALTRRMQKLEAYLGVRLLDRTTRSLQLTAVGREFLPQAARMVADMTAAVERLKDMSRLGRGSITMASIPTMAHHALPLVIRRYAQKYPSNRIRIIESGAFDVSRAVLNGQAEFGITLELERHADLLEEPVLQEPFMFFCREGHPLAGRSAITCSLRRSHACTRHRRRRLHRIQPRRRAPRPGGGGRRRRHARHRAPQQPGGGRLRPRRAPA